MIYCWNSRAFAVIVDTGILVFPEDVSLFTASPCGEAVSSEEGAQA
jgi:hypothetical protein